MFLPLALMLNYFSPKPIRNLILTILSLFFYSMGEGTYFAVMVLSIIINYFFGLLIGNYQSRRIFLFVGILINLLILFYFKYLSFIVGELTHVFSFTIVQDSFYKNIYLPLGISFFTFHSLSYLIDTYRKLNKPFRNFIDLSLYISFFPQLIAGPIVRFHEISDQIKNRTITIDGFSYGVERFIIGLGKKVIIANTLAVPVDQIFALPENELTTTLAWTATILYSLQIFYDFSGYSDMAIGLARMFGFRFPENFNYPYSSTSFKEFWSKWHITLSKWFKDYLYIPLGGNKMGGVITIRNLFIVFILCGIWHGASWNFLLWGLYHGIFLSLERISIFKRILNFNKPLSHFYFLFFITLSWVLFRANNIEHAIDIYKTLFDFNFTDFNLLSYYLDNYIIFCSILGIIFIFPHTSIFNKIHRPIFFIYLYVIFFLSVMLLSVDTYNPFIYFRF